MSVILTSCDESIRTTFTSVSDQHDSSQRLLLRELTSGQSAPGSRYTDSGETTC